MEKHFIRNFFGKAVMSILVIVMMISVVWLSDVEGGVAYAADETYYITETQPGLTVTDDMTAPKPTTEGKETYIFAGYYAEATCVTPIKESTDATVYKKFVPADIMSVKAQVTQGTKEDSSKTDMRLVTTVDGLNYKEVGFDVYFNGSKTPVNAKTTTVYKRIIAADSGNAFGYTPEAFNTDAEYFTTVNLVNIANKNFDKTFFIKPYWKTLDGTKVYGMSRMARVSDSYNDIVNIPVRLYTDDTVAAGTFDVGYTDYASILTYKGYDNGEVYESVVAENDTENTKVTVTTPSDVEGADGMVVNLRFQVNDGQTMPSNATFTVTSDYGTALANVEYKTFSVAYTGVADTSWYDGFKNGTEFVLTTPADLYGFAQIVNDTSGDYKNEQFAGDTVRLGADITVNTGSATNWETTAPTYAWTPIGDATTFAGTFDGGMHTINGIYLNTEKAEAGFFGEIAATGNVRNLYIKNSLFKSTTTDLGSVAGISRGTISTVFSDAIVVSSQVRSGGIVGSMLNTASVDNCWFDGTITLTTANGKQSGGIVGYIAYGTANSNVSITNCLYTGDLTFAATSTTWGLRIGGIAGGAHDYHKPTITLENCVSAGTVKQTSGSTNIPAVSAVYGGFDEPRDVILNLENVFATNECCSTGRIYHQYFASATATGNPPTINGEGTLLAESELKGYTNRNAISSLGIYTNNEKDDSDYWVITEDSTPELKSFCEEWVDFGWYDNRTDGEDYVIATAEEMYALTLISAEDTFEGDVIKLADDIKLNNGMASVWSTTENTAIIDSLRTWKPIGISKAFAGTFDGQMHTISGVYLNTTAAKAGLFGQIAATGNVSNCYLKDSYFKSTTTDMGSVVGISKGTISTVFSDAIVVSSQVRSGGIVGSMLNTASVDNCWFDGTMTLTTDNGKQSGGIVGYIAYGTANTNVSIKNCLYTGDLTFTATAPKWGLRIGGIAGGAHDYQKPTITLENCVSAGSIVQANGSTSTPAVSAVYGGFDEPRDVVLNLINVYGTNECCATGRIYHQYFANASTSAPPTINGTGTLIATSELHGVAGYKNTLLDFEKVWAARSEDVPALKEFVENPLSIANAVRPDTSWYNAEETRQEILDEADMYGFMELMAEGNTFADKEIYLMADLTKMNKVESGTIDKWMAGTEVPDNQWVAGTKFAGKFDGQMHTISGIYLNTTTAGAGLFGEITATGEVSNFYIKDSFFKSTTTDMGSVAGISRGTISTVFSDAIVVSSQLRSGGIVGSMLNTASVDNCWFDGTITLTTANGKQSGGIVGYIANGTANSNVSITNCLYTGDLTFAATSTTWGLRIGGIAGGAHDYQKPTITLENCVSAGSVAQVDGSEDIPAVSAVYGGFDEPRDVILNLVNVYGTNECCATGRIYHQYFASATATGNPPTVNGEGTLIATSELHGVAGYKNTLLDFETAWAARSEDVPALKEFVENSLSIANAVRPDTSWYNAEETRQEILDEADMYGFMELMAEGNTFADKEIYLMADLTKMNKVESGTIDKWMAGTEVPDNQWVAGTKFAGKFDGQMHTISGIYLNTTTAGAGLFGEITATGEVSNFYIKDSFFKSTTTDMGSVAGISRGTISTVFSDAIVVSSQLRSGGIVGSMLNTASVDNCWFDGTITLTTDNGKQSGGIVGYIAQGTANTKVSITNCLYTGDLTFTATAPKWGLRIGGIAGGAHDYQKPTITLENCLSAGTVIQTNGSTSIPAVSTVYGGFDEPRDVVLNLVNVYGTNECCTTGRIYHQYFANASTAAPPAINGTGILMGESELQGTAGYQNTLLDFEDTWVAREGDVPTLKAFTNEIGTVADLTGIEQNNWYDADETVFGIASTSALKAFSTYSATYDFTDKTVLLLDNIEVNAVEEGTLTAWKAGTGTLPGSWTPIGATKAFAGTFDGQMHTISGVYLNTTTAKAGLFGQIAATGNVSNFYLKDSYFKSTATDMGSIVGISKGTISTVYSDAVIVSSQLRTGGIVGSMLNATSVDHCWFDGEMTLTTDNGKQAGGIVGYIAYGTANTNVSITNCLYTGDLTFTATAPKWGLRIGGIAGGAHDYQKPTITLENCLSAGTIKQASGSTSIPAVSAVYGGFDEPRDVVLNLVNVYATNECCATGRIYHQYFANASTSAPPTINGTGTLLKEADLYGTWGYQNTLLDFENDWAARNNDVPGLKAFVDAPVSVADTIRPDTSWYDAEAADLEIQDAADMYGFMQLLAEGKTFEGQTIKVMAELVMNPTDEDTVSKWQAGTVVPNNKWVSSYTGKTTNFAGTFDGNEQTISGIYCVGDYEYLGLFGTTLTGSTVKNFKLTDSYFKQTGTGNTGSIAGAVQGTIDSVYTDAIIESAGLYVGGIAAYTSGTIYGTNVVSTEDTSETEKTVTATAYRDVVNIKNCWFDGVINATTEKTWARIGGLVGYVSEGRLDMANCLFTGKIDAQEAAASARVGGFVGTRNSNAKPTTSTTSTTDGIKTTTTITSTYEDTGEEAYPMLYLVSSIAAGEITVSGNEDTVGSAIGYVEYGKFDDVFVTRDTYPITHSVATATFTGQPIQTYNTDRLVGYCVEPTYGFTLDFEGEDATWSMRTSGVPVPKALEGVVGAENIVDVSTLTAEIGLDTWNKTLAEAEDYGMGNYVVSADATYNTYTAYLTKLDNELDFDPYTDNSESDMDDDGVYNAIYTKDSGDWVLNITFVEKEGKIYISISTIGEDGLSDNLQATEANIALANATNETTKEVSFSMLELNGNNGNSFVFKLPNGHFIINDGGKKKASADDGTELINELDPLLDYLQELAGTEKVVIDAWIFSHTHDDHIAVAVDIFGDAEWKENVSLNAIYLTEANDETKLLDGTSAINYVNESFRGLLSLTQEDNVSKPAIHRMHMGERYYFSGMTMDVVQAHEQIALDVYTDTENYDDPDRFNATSTNCVYTLTNTGKKILIGGDSNNINMQYMMMAYGKSYTTYDASSQQYGGISKTLSNINVFAAYHHGKNVISTYKAYRPSLIDYVRKAEGTNEWADYLLKNTNNPDGFKFDLVLFSYKEVFDMNKYTGDFTSGGVTYSNIWVGDDGVSIMHPYNLSELNQYYINNAEAYYTYGYEDHDADGNIRELEDLTRHGTVQFIYREDKSVETVIHDSNITQ